MRDLQTKQYTDDSFKSDIFKLRPRLIEDFNHMIRDRIMKRQGVKSTSENSVGSEILMDPSFDEPILMKSKEEQIELIRSQLTNSFSPTKENSVDQPKMTQNSVGKSSMISQNFISQQKAFPDIVEPHEIPLNPHGKNVAQMGVGFQDSTFSQIPFPPMSQMSKTERSGSMSMTTNVLTTSQIPPNMPSRQVPLGKISKTLTSQNASGQASQDFNFPRPLPNEVVDLRSLV